MEKSLQSIVDQVHTASAARSRLRIQGGGTKDFLADAQTNALPHLSANIDSTQLPGEVLDTRMHSGIVSYEPSELVITAKAGTPLAEIEAALAAHGQCLPFEPPRFAAAHTDGNAAGKHGGTVGGMVAAGLSGPARASVGALRDYVLGVHIVNGKAEHLVFGGQVMKNVAGYDMSRLIAGSWGMLGVVTEVSLKVLPVAPAEATLCFEMAQADALAQLNHWGGEPLPLNASNWVMDSVGGVPTPLLFVRLRGAVAAVEAACKTMLAQHKGTRMDNAQASGDWQLSRDLQLPFFHTQNTSLAAPAQQACLWRISVPQTAPVLDLPCASAAGQLVDWHGAQRWLWAPASADAQIRAAAQAAGGSAMLFRGHAPLGSSRFEAVEAPLDRIHRQLKAEFDPAGIFNPGRMPWFA
jgi:glycolate oxidase FAD binding subunit